MNKTLKITCLVLAAILIVLSIYSYFKIRKLTNRSQLQAVELSTLKDSVSVLASDNGELTYKLTAIEVDKRNLKESLEVAGYDIRELKDRDIKWRKVTNSLRLQLSAKGSGSAPLHDTITVMKTVSEIDTVHSSNFAWSNDYLSFSGNVVDKRLTFDYSYQTKIDFFTEDKKKGTLVSVMLSDPNASVATANSIMVKPKKKIWQKWWLWGLVGMGAGVFIAK